MRVSYRKVQKLLPKLVSIEREISGEKGDFTLFGLFLREDQPHREWDLIISADWLDTHLDSKRIFTKSIQSRLERDEFLLLALVLIFRPDHPLVKQINSEFEIEHGNIEVIDYDFNGMFFERGHIITSKGQGLQTKKGKL